MANVNKDVEQLELSHTHGWQEWKKGQQFLIEQKYTYSLTQQFHSYIFTQEN